MNHRVKSMNTNIILLGFSMLSGAIFLRLAIGLYPYSGFRRPPMYGDFEAQRHWMEVTINLPIKEWYLNTSTNDLNYWGLDYPPLTAYHSYLTGMLSFCLNSSWTTLTLSRGHESYNHKLFMRYSVLIPDLAIYFTAVIKLVIFSHGFSSFVVIQKNLISLLLILIQPGLLLIDYGHFQYNCVSLGLALWGIIGVTSKWDLMGAASFCLALNYKQMELYHALPFFFYLLGKSYKLNSIGSSIVRITKLGLVVVSIFGMLWMPFYVPNGIHGLQHVLSRIFPFNRGLFEDKVASFWCAISFLVKMKQIFSVSILLKISLVTTLFCSMPSLLMVLWNPTSQQFVLSLINTSLSFFLFSFQVHEKSILLVTLPINLLLWQHPYFVSWFNAVATFSMYPLLVKDGLVLATWATVTLYLVIFVLHYGLKHCNWAVIFLGMSTLSVLAMLCVCSHLVTPPQSLPDIFPLMISCYSCCLFLLSYIYVTYLLYYCTSTNSSPKKHQD